MVSWDPKYSLVGILAIGGYTSGFAKYVISPVVPDITSSFNVTTGEIGLALSIMWFVFAILQLPGGVLSDKLGEKNMLLISIGLLFLGSSLMFQAPIYPLFVLATVLLGAGSGIYLIASSSYISKQFVDIGGAIGVVSVGSSVAGLLAPVAAVAVARYFDWRVSVFLGAIFAGPTILLVYSRLEPTPPARPDDGLRDVFSKLTVIFRPEVLITTIIASTGYFVFQSTTSFFPTFMVQHGGLTFASAGIALSVFFLMNGIGNPIFGKLSDKLGRDPILFFCLSLCALGYLYLIIFDTTILVGLGVLSLGLGFGWGATITSRFMDSFPRAERGTGYGLANTVANILGSTGSVVTGVLASLYGWTAAISLLIVMCAISLTVIAFSSVSGIGQVTTKGLTS